MLTQECLALGRLGRSKLPENVLSRLPGGDVPDADAVPQAQREGARTTTPMTSRISEGYPLGCVCQQEVTKLASHRLPKGEPQPAARLDAYRITS